MKLELKHLAAYFPYGLICDVDGEKARLDAIYEDGSCCFFELVESERGFSSIKPILKTIQDADTYLRTEFLKSQRNEKCDIEATDLFCFEKIGSNKLLSELDVLMLPYDSVQWLLKNHYDVFGLVE